MRDPRGDDLADDKRGSERSFDAVQTADDDRHETKARNIFLTTKPSPQALLVKTSVFYSNQKINAMEIGFPPLEGPTFRPTIRCPRPRAIPASPP